MLPWKREVLSPGSQDQHAKKMKIIASSASRICTSPRDGGSEVFLSNSLSLRWAKKMPNSLQKQRAQSTTTNCFSCLPEPPLGSPEQFHGMLLWDLWKARGALLNASFPCNLSQKGVQSWLLIVWCVENTFLNLFHKYHLGTCREQKTPLLSHSRSYFRWRGVSKALNESDKQRDYEAVHVPHTHCVSFPFRKKACIFTGWQILRSMREGKGTAVYLPKSCFFPVFRRGLQTSTTSIHCSFYAHYS